MLIKNTETSKRKSVTKNNLENHVRKQSSMDDCGLVSYDKCVDKVESKLFHFATDHLPFLVCNSLLLFGEKKNNIF